MLPQVPQTRFEAEKVADQLAGGERDQDLTAVAGRQQASAAVERRPEVIAVSLVGRAGVQRHPDPQLTHLAGSLRSQPALGGNGRIGCCQG